MIVFNKRINMGERNHVFTYMVLSYIPTGDLQGFVTYLYAGLDSKFFCCCCSAMSDSWWPHVLQHARLLCPSLPSRVCSDSCPLIQRCHPAISSSATHMACCPQSFPASGSFPMSWLFASSGQSIGASGSASAAVLPIKIQCWFPFLNLVELSLLFFYFLW